uniref:Uncharacterized protein n=1 Tax=Oryza rufipogon TaxID=4529 RepID=A0A0E0PGP3_ORYRU
MEVFQVAHFVRLRSSVRSSRYLAAADDGTSVFLCGRRGVHNAVWAVEPVIGVIPGASAGPYVRLRGAYGRYLVATNYGAGRGPSDGVVAEQRDLGVRPTPPGYLWQAFRRRDSFVLRNGAGRYLRANGRFRRWHKDVSVAGDNASTMMQWRVEVVPPMASRPSLVDLPAQLMHRTNPPVESDLSRVIRYVRADNAGRYGEQEWAPVRVNTNNLTHLRLTMAERLGQNCDAGQITLCVRAGRYAHLSPLLVDLPMGNNPIHIVVLNHGTPARENPQTMGSRSKISLKLLVDSKSKKVLFAEAGKEFVDFVFSLLTLPVGAVVKLISAGTMQGSIGRLYQSVEHINASYLLPNKDRADLLQPKVLHPDARELLLLQPESGGAGGSPLARFKLYTCAGHCTTAAMEAKAACPQCKKAMDTEVALVLPSASSPAQSSAAASGGDGESSGYVKGLVTYMVTDGLEVTPMSAISSITLINKFSVGKDVELAEKYVSIAMDEGLGILKAALRSDTVLSDVFLAKKK